jgi:hypothetical protein
MLERIANIAERLNLWDFMMKNRTERIYFLLAILLSFLLISSLAYAHYDELIEIDLLSSYPAFENPDQEGLAADKQNNAKVFVQISSPVICSSSFFYIEQLQHFSSPLLSFPGSISVLRC